MMKLSEEDKIKMLNKMDIIRLLTIVSRELGYNETELRNSSKQDLIDMIIDNDLRVS